METLGPGDRVRIVYMPEGGRRFVGQVGTVMTMGGFGHAPQSVMVRVGSESLMLLCEQVELLQRQTSTSSHNE